MRVMTGMDLRVERIRARIQVQQLAAEMGLSRQRVSQVESLAHVSAGMESRYRAALARCISREQAA